MGTFLGFVLFLVAAFPGAAAAATGERGGDEGSQGQGRDGESEEFFHTEVKRAKGPGGCKRKMQAQTPRL